MKLSALIAQLVALAEELNGDLEFEGGDLSYLGDTMHVDPEVRIAYQPTYPLAAILCCATHLTPTGDDDERLDATEDEPGVLWLAAGSSPHDEPYAPRTAWGE